MRIALGTRTSTENTLVASQMNRRTALYAQTNPHLFKTYSHNERAHLDTATPAYENPYK